MLALTRHPDSAGSTTLQIGVDIAPAPDGGLFLSYVVTGCVADIRLPAAARPARGDGLWRHTCFELFVAAPPGAAYYEFNFSPSTAWAAYRFERYRAGRRGADEISAIPIETHAATERYTLRAVVPRDRLAGLPRDAAWRLGLATVIEDARGDLSYWALKHPPGKPDFHHADGFAHELVIEVAP